MQEDLRAPYETQHGDAVMESVIKARNGSVLGTGSILKMYFFPGQRTSRHIQIHGAPHVYKVLHGLPLFLSIFPFSYCSQCGKGNIIQGIFKSWMMQRPLLCLIDTRYLPQLNATECAGK